MVPCNDSPFRYQRSLGWSPSTTETRLDGYHCGIWQWKLETQLHTPLHLWDRSLHDKKDNIIADFKSYLANPKSQRSNAAWFVEALETELRRLGMVEFDMAVIGLSRCRISPSRQHTNRLANGDNSINSNACSLCFWKMSDLLEDPALYSSIRSEFDVALSHGLSGLSSRLENYESPSFSFYWWWCCVPLRTLSCTQWHKEALTFVALAISRYDIKLAAEQFDGYDVPFPRCVNE